MNSWYIQYIPIYIPILGWLKCCFLGYLMSLIQFDPHRSLSRGLVQGNCHVETAMVFFPSNIRASCKTMGNNLKWYTPNDLMPFGGYWCRVDMGWHGIPSTFSLSDPGIAQVIEDCGSVARTPSTVPRVCFSYSITIHSLHGWNPIYIKYGKIFKISSWRAGSLWFMGVCIDNPMLWHEDYWNSISAWVVFNGSGQYSVPFNGFKI